MLIIRGVSPVRFHNRPVSPGVEMMFFPKKALSKLYNHTSLRQANGVVSFSVKNRLSPATVFGISRVAIHGRDIPVDKGTVTCNNAPPMLLSEVSLDNPIDFPLGDMLTFKLILEPLSEGEHNY